MKNLNLTFSNSRFFLSWKKKNRRMHVNLFLINFEHAATFTFSKTIPLSSNLSKECSGHVRKISKVTRGQ